MSCVQIFLGGIEKAEIIFFFSSLSFLASDAHFYFESNLLSSAHLLENENEKENENERAKILVFVGLCPFVVYLSFVSLEKIWQEVQFEVAV